MWCFVSFWSHFAYFLAFFFGGGGAASGTRIGQASECFVYWKDPATNDTWGLNFTSPADARAFRECCVRETSNPKTQNPKKNKQKQKKNGSERSVFSRVMDVVVFPSITAIDQQRVARN